ncbi:MAG: site-specific DNA-methyltransferase [Candidatus Lokiarchaeota archaeon]|nr:site-specific DNA-methyltransferase [Candidatus Lokiarchaeota archaeon]
MTKRSSLDIINSFLATRGCRLDPRPYLDNIPTFSRDYADLPGDIVEKIIRDSYDDANPIVKRISEELADRLNVFIGRIHKNQIKKYIDYERQEDLHAFVQLIGECDADAETIKNVCNEIIRSNSSGLGRSIPVFWSKLEESIFNENKDRIKDYLVFLYSRLLALNENHKITLHFLFEQERDLIRKELVTARDEKELSDDFRDLERFCDSTTVDDHASVVTSFNKRYQEILERGDGTHGKKSLVFVDVNQAFFDSKGSKEEFFDHLFHCTAESFGVLRNHRVLVIKVGNVMDGGLNLKWEIYAQITIFAEKMRPTRFNRTYYRGEEICADVIEHRIGAKLSPDDLERLKGFYSEDLRDANAFSGTLASPEIREIMEFYKEPLAGYAFIDCYVLQQDRAFPNSLEIKFIENKNELLLVFYKNAVDERKIPCPVCGSLKISGNSYTEIGEKSWECKNPLCAERSKTNRGKRYSMRTIFMQDSLFDFRPETTVPKSLIKVWRKDLVEHWTNEQLFAMIIKYYTYPGETILAINLPDAGHFRSVAYREKRQVESISFAEFAPADARNKGTWTRFLDGPLFEQFARGDPRPRGPTITPRNFPLRAVRKVPICVVQDDCTSVMQQLEDKAIHAMITSPPYYNAREYSQWANLYTYLADMYRMIVLAKEKLVPGGVFFFNVGDIYDNEKTIVKSTMGNKRIPLGAYVVLLFQRAGFVLLDNVVWYKGEPQSNRQKNDGNFVPFYQRPTNCYEHMFIFKAPGSIRLAMDRSKNTLHANVQKFSPVIKIGRGGINKYGHTAPFPPELPMLAISCFTNPGDLVFDPYSGSGTTAIAAATCDRCGIGTEMNRDYARLSVGMARERGLPFLLLKRSGGGDFVKEVNPPPDSSTPAQKQATLDSFGEGAAGARNPRR